MLRPIVREALGVPDGIEPDPMLRFPETYRRMPNAYRAVEDDGHILGMPRGTWVRQVTVWEQWRERAASNVTALFFRAEPFHEQASDAEPHQRRRSDGAAVTPVRGDLTREQVAFCEEMLRNHFGDWPKLDRLTHERGRWVARYFNSAQDRNAASMLREDHTNVLLAGTGAELSKSSPAGLPARPDDSAVGPAT